MVFVGRSHKALSRQGGDLLRDFFGKTCGRVQSRADCCAAQGQLGQGLHSQADQLHISLQRAAPAADLLGETDRDRILQMGPAALDDPLVLRLQGTEGLDESLCRRDQAVLKNCHCRDVHGRRESVVGRLAHIDVVVGMAEFVPRDLICPVGDHLIGIHIGLCSGTRLPDNQGEVCIQLSGDHFVRRCADRFQLLCRHFFRFQSMIGSRRCLFQNAECPDDFPGHGLDADADGKVSAAPLCLGRPVFVRRYSYLTHGIMFDPVFHSLVLSLC